MFFAKVDQGIIIANGYFMVTNCSNIPFSRAEALVHGENLKFLKPVNLEIGREYESMCLCWGKSLKLVIMHNYRQFFKQTGLFGKFD